MIVSTKGLQSLVGLAEMGHSFIFKLPIGSVHNDNDLKRKASENDRENPKKRCVGNL